MGMARNWQWAAVNGGWRPEHRPALHQSLRHGRPIGRCPPCPGLHHLERQRGPQRRSRIVAMPPRQLDQLGEDPRLTGPIGAPISERFLLRYSLPLRHCQLHRNGHNPHPPAQSQATPKRRFSNEATNTATRRFLMSQRDHLTSHIEGSVTSAERTLIPAMLTAPNISITRE